MDAVEVKGPFDFGAAVVANVFVVLGFLLLFVYFVFFVAAIHFYAATALAWGWFHGRVFLSIRGVPRGCLL